MLKISSATLLSLAFGGAHSTSLKVFEGKHEKNEPDFAGLAYLEAKERQILESSKLGKSPSKTVTRPPNGERLATTDAPSPSPSGRPSTLPSQLPSDFPTLVPSGLPSNLPSEGPSPMPSKDKYPQGRPPEDKQGYFNYNSTSYEGPSFWGTIDLPENYYWNEFTNNSGFGTWKGILDEREPWENKCRKGRKQSPIDVRENGAICEEFHEIRDKPGIYKLTNSIVKKTIEPNKLRIQYPRRICQNVTHPWYALDPLCQDPSPPLGDFPNGWRGTGDVLHIDFKLPGEHTIWGESFHAEMQIFHVHPVNMRVPAVTTMIRAQVDGFNFYLQEAINAFQIVYDQNQADCAYFKQTGRVVGKSVEANTPTSSPTWGGTGRATVPPRNLKEESDVVELDNSNMTDHDVRSRDLQVRFVWNPYHAMLIPTIYFYRYDGSLTEPPCAEMVSWFVSDQPMIISFEQLEQMKQLLFTNVDQTCHMTSVHSESSVARPIQPTYNRSIWKCTSENYVADPK